MRNHYQDEIDKYREEQEEKLRRKQQQLEDQMYSEIDELKESKKEVIDKNHQLEKSELIVKYRIKLDQFIENSINEVIEVSIDEFFEMLKTDDELADEYYVKNLEYIFSRYTDIQSIGVDNHGLKPVKRWIENNHNGCNVINDNTRGLIIESPELEIEISPITLCETQEREIKNFLRDKLFGG